MSEEITPDNHGGLPQGMAPGDKKTNPVPKSIQIQQQFQRVSFQLGETIFKLGEAELLEEEVERLKKQQKKLAKEYKEAHELEALLAKKAAEKDQTKN